MPTRARRLHLVLALVVLGLAALLRLWALDARPPHHDEGVNGFLVEQMMRTGYYRYDPRNFHGPLFFYLLAASRRLIGYGIVALRLPPALLGVALCALSLALGRALDCRARLGAALLLASSPVLVYYARDAIHETLLALEMLACLVCLVRHRDGGRGWLVAAGAIFGAMLATKETAVLFAAAVAPPWIVDCWLAPATVGAATRARRWRAAASTGALALAAAALVASAAFTGLFRAPEGPWPPLRHAVEAYQLWRHTGTQPTGHAKPWWYYLALVGRHELGLALLALGGTVAGWRCHAVRLAGSTALALFVLYSALAYKTPWLLVGPLALAALPAGWALARLIDGARAPRRGTVAVAAGAPRRGRAVELLALALTLAAGGGAWHVAIARPTDARAGLAYVHTDARYAEVERLIDGARAAAGADRLRVCASGLQTAWPLPWTLLPIRHVRWRCAALGAQPDLAFASAAAAPRVAAVLRGRYARFVVPLRPGLPPITLWLRASTMRTVIADARARGDQLRALDLPSALAAQWPRQHPVDTASPRG